MTPTSAPPIAARKYSGTGTFSKKSSEKVSVRMNATATRPAATPTAM